jgi:hypothetical protein
MRLAEKLDWKGLKLKHAAYFPLYYELCTTNLKKKYRQIIRKTRSSLVHVSSVNYREYLSFITFKDIRLKP